MINATDLRKRLLSRFPETHLTEVRPGIFRAESKFADRTYEVHYFDSTSPFGSSDFDLQTYQTALMAEDYYSHPGSLQWNYYLNFVVDEEDLRSSALRSAAAGILENRSLARKTITPVSRLSDLFPKRISVSSDLPRDIKDIWLAQLEPMGLEEALDATISLDSVVERFVTAGASPKTTARNPRLDVAAKLPFITSFNLESYREFPERRDYTFGQVNLIHGANATGKTSLLEALELAICGRTKRNKTQDESFQFAVTYGGNSEPVIVSPLPEKEYRDRDSSWYGRSYSKGNDLCESFARFNFFDSDAAVRFASDLESSDLFEALKPIVFGAEAQALEKRLSGVHKRFEIEVRHTQERLHALEADISILTTHLKELRERHSPSISKEVLMSKLRGIGLRDPLMNKGLPAIANVLANIDLDIAELTSTNDTAPIHTVRDLRSTHSDTQVRRDEFAALENARVGLESRRTSLEAELRKHDEALQSLDKLADYAQNNAFILIAEPELRQQQARLEILSKVATGIAALDLEPFRENSASFADLKAELQRAIGATAVRLQAVSQQVNHLKNTATRSRVFREEIWQRAEGLLQLDPHLEDCPLCGATHRSPTLKERVAEQRARPGDATRDIASVLNEFQDLQNSFQVGTRQHETLDKLLALAATCIPHTGDIYATSPGETIRKIESSISERDTLATEIASRERQLATLTARGYTSAIAVHLLRHFDLLPTNISSLPSFVEMATEDTRNKVSNLRAGLFRNR